jgi:hypothetical protein
MAKGSMDDFPAVLFPHNHLPDLELKRLLSFFGPLTVFQPWLMERAVLSAVSKPPCRILRPPDSLNPGGRLKVLLSEYHNWISQHHERSRVDFIKAVQGRGPSDASTWAIRQMLRGEIQDATDAPEDDSLRRHLLLHLAQDVEDQRREADRLLIAVKYSASPLEEALGEEVTNEDALLGDLPAFDSEPAILDEHFGLRLEAWFGLFGRNVKDDEFLITDDRQVTAYVNASRADRSSAADQTAVRFRVPDLSSYDVEGLQERKAALFKNSRAGELRKSLLEYQRNPSVDLTTLAKLAEEVEASHPWGSADEALRITVTFPDPAATAPPSDPAISLLARHPLILVEAVAPE